MISGDGVLTRQWDTQYKAVCVLYEPFPDPKLMAIVGGISGENGGTVVWTGIPPLHASAQNLAANDLFGAEVAGTA